MQELLIDFCEDEVFDESLDDFNKTGKLQISLSGSDRALEELKVRLIP